MKQVNFFNRKVFRKDVVIMLLIVALPFLFYLYKLVPEVKVIETKYFTYDSRHFEDVSVLAWVLFTKLLTFLILIIWFLTCKHWWKKALLIPIIIECHKIIIILNSDLYFIDKNEFLWSLPIVIPIAMILLFLSNKLNYYSQSINTSAELDKEINELLDKLSIFKEDNFKTVKNNLKELRRQKETMNNEDYLKKLIALRDNIVKL